jgi:hypothetical protein
MKNKIWAALTIAAATGCASSTKEIAATYQSPLVYQNYTCDQLGFELSMLNTRAIELGAQVDKASVNDNVLTGVTLVLFWPAVFALGGNEAEESEYAKVKGDITTIQQVAVAQDCAFPDGQASQTAKVEPESKVN